MVNWSEEDLVINCQMTKGPLIQTEVLRVVIWKCNKIIKENDYFSPSKYSFTVLLLKHGTPNKGRIRIQMSTTYSPVSIGCWYNKKLF